MFNEVAYDDSNLGFAWPSLIGAGGSIGGSVVGGILAGAGHGAIAGPIGAGIGILTGLIGSIFGAHKAKVAREDEISGAWAASGPKAIDAVMQAYHSGSISASEASQALDSIEAQFYSMTAPITKYNGKFGSFPDANGPRPPDKCNWACGTSWDLHQQLLGYKAQLTAGGGGLSGGIAGLNLGGLTKDPVALVGLGILAYMLMK